MPYRRMFQQFRLWLYMILIFSSALYSMYRGDHDVIAFIVGIIFVLLLFLEICDECKRIVWLEKGPFGPGPFWIGRECREPRNRGDSKGN